MTKTLNEYIELYEEKTGEEFVVPAGFQLLYLPERGFAEIMIHEGLVVVYQMCGDLLFWFDTAKLMAESNDLRAVATICILPILPYIRLLRCRIKEDIVQNGHHRYICEDAVGNTLICTYRSTEEGTDTYFCTYYIGGQNG